MPNFEMQFELSGLKISIKSDREEASAALGQVQNQLGSLLQSAAGLGEPAPTKLSHVNTSVSTKVIEAPVNASESRSRGPKRNRTRAIGGSSPVVYEHTESLGQPLQSWNTARKAMWMLLILEQQTGKRDYSTNEITATFNQNFKHFGAVTTTNVSRDLGKMRTKRWIGVDASKEPQTWYLLGDGTTEVNRLIAEGEAA